MEIWASALGRFPEVQGVWDAFRNFLIFPHSLFKICYWKILLFIPPLQESESHRVFQSPQYLRKADFYSLFYSLASVNELHSLWVAHFLPSEYFYCRQDPILLKISYMGTSESFQRCLFFINCWLCVIAEVYSFFQNTYLSELELPASHWYDWCLPCVALCVLCPIPSMKLIWQRNGFFPVSYFLVAWTKYWIPTRKGRKGLLYLTVCKAFSPYSAGSKTGQHGKWTSLQRDSSWRNTHGRNQWVLKTWGIDRW